MMHRCMCDKRFTRTPTRAYVCMCDTSVSHGHPHAHVYACVTQAFHTDTHTRICMHVHVLPASRTPRGNVSTDNSGGFASVRSRNFEPAFDLGAYDGLELRVKVGEREAATLNSRV